MRCRSCCAAALLLLAMSAGIGAAPPAAAQSRGTAQSTAAAQFHRAEAPSREPRSPDRARFLRWAYQDAGALALHVGTRAPLYALGGAALFASGQPLDAPLQGEVRAMYGGAPGMAGVLDAANWLGDRRVALPAAGIFAITLATDDARLQDAAFTSLQALLYSSLLTDAVKSVVGRARPEAGLGAYHTASFSGRTSFPSGHTTAAFAVLTPWVLYYPSLATYGLFALSAGTAVARLGRDKHWPTDVVAGAAIGFFTARYLTGRHQNGRFTSRLRVAPLVHAGAVGVHVRLRLD